MAHIARCLDALFNLTHPPREVVVVDNGSTDGSRELVQSRYPQVRLIERPVNEGVARGYNLGVQHTTCPFILILNADVFLDRDFLCAALRAIRSAPDIGSVAPRVCAADSGRVSNVGLYLRGRIGFVNSANATEPEFVFSGSGSALLCRREMLEDVAVLGEVFDVSFFAYKEDLDLAWRAQLRGWRCLYVPEAVVYHVGSASQGGAVRVAEKPVFFQRHSLKNQYLTLVKNASGGLLFVLLPWVVVTQVLFCAYVGVRFPFRSGLFFLALGDAVRLLPETLRKRRLIQRGRKVRDRELLRFFKGF